MTNSRWLIAKSYIYLFILVIFISLLVYVNVYGQENIPLVYELKPSDSSRPFFKFGDMPHLGSSVSGYGEVDAVVKDGIDNMYNVKTVLTDDNYFSFYNLDFVEGSFFDSNIVDSKWNCVVISENLSKEMFPLSNSIGKKIYVDDFSYVVIGVYKSKNSFWESLSSDKYERIFIPYTSYPHNDEISLTSLSILNDDGAITILDNLKIKYPNISRNFIEIDYIEMKKYSTQFVLLLVNIIKLITLVVILRFLYKLASGYVKEMRKHREKYYLGKLIIHNKKYFIALVTSFTVGIALFVFLCKDLTLEIAMSNNFIPTENLFDISYYLDKISLFYIYRNSSYIIGQQFYYRLVYMTLIASIGISVIIYPCIILFMSKYKNLAKSRYIPSMEIIFYLIILLICLLVISSNMMSGYINSGISVLVHFIVLIMIVFFDTIRQILLKSIKD